MSTDINCCKVCGNTYGIEQHHIVFRSQAKPLEKCKLNYVYLCGMHHRDHKVGVHFNRKLDKNFKLEFQNTLEVLFDKRYFTEDEISKVLGISIRATRSLCKTVVQANGVFARADIIRACMGGIMII